MVRAMTMPGTMQAAAPADRAVWRDEMAETVKLALPIALTHTVLFMVFMFGMGFISAVAPLAAQFHGAREPRMMRRALLVGLWTAVHLLTARHYLPAIMRDAPP